MPVLPGNPWPTNYAGILNAPRKCLHLYSDEAYQYQLASLVDKGRWGIGRVQGEVV